MTECTCTGYDPADPCMHGDTSKDCPKHDPNYEPWDAEDCDEYYPMHLQNNKE